MLVVDELMHGQQLERGDAELNEVVDDRRVRQPCVRATKLRRYLGVTHGEPLDVCLVYHRVVERDVRSPVVLPVEERIHHHRLWDETSAVAAAGRAERITETIRKHRLVPSDIAVGRLGVRVEEQLAGIAQQALLGTPRAVNSVTVSLTGTDGGKVGVPYVSVHFLQIYAGLAMAVKET